jgi:hypothetical protein
MKSSLKSLFVLLVVAPMGSARLPFSVHTLAPLTQRFYKKRLSSAAVSSTTTLPLSVIAVPRCGAATDLKTGNEKNKGKISNVGDKARFAILLVGWSLGYTFYFPNIMMSDSGSAEAILAAKTGVLASLLLALGGCVGYVSKTIGWKALIPGVLCQVLALFAFSEARGE